MITLAHSPDVSCLFNLDHQCPSPSSVPAGSLPPASEYQPRGTHFVFPSQQHPTSSAGFYISQRPYHLGPPLYTPKSSGSFPKHSLLLLALSPACWEASPTVRGGHLEHTGFEDLEVRGETGRRLTAPAPSDTVTSACGLLATQITGLHLQCESICRINGESVAL